jgi:pilus assembly protein CpaF
VTATVGTLDERALAARIREIVVDQLARHPGRDRLDGGDQRQLVRGWIEDQLGLEARRRLHAGEAPLKRSDEARVLAAVENLVWGLGRLQALLDRPDVEDIHIVGAARPVLRLSDGRIDVTADPVAADDEDLIRQLQHIAAHHGSSERAFSPAQPCLNMQLPDGSRLAAVRDIVASPTVTIRRHRFVDVTLDDLARHGTLSWGMLGFLRALIAAHRSVIVTGVPASGKTTLLRAMAREIPTSERVATLETEFELDLHRLPQASPLLVAMECRAGSTETDPATGRHAGQITLSDLLHQTLRMSVTRVIVGEVRGAEALPMLEAMNAGMPGSLCTLHAGSATDAFERLVTAALKGAGSGWSDSFVTRLAAQGVDYVVHLRHLPRSRLGQPRFVSEIAEVTDVNEVGAVAMNRIFGPADGDPRGRFLMAPQLRWPFEEAGISLDFLRDPQVDRWAAPRRRP